MTDKSRIKPHGHPRRRSVWTLLLGAGGVSAPLSSRAGGIDSIPEVDSPVVARLRTAGAIILGKTNVPMFSVSGDNANDSWAGPTYNAAAPMRAPGASSAGTATAVAASFAVLGLGEETGGSIQNPAAEFFASGQLVEDMALTHSIHWTGV